MSLPCHHACTCQGLHSDTTLQAQQRRPAYNLDRWRSMPPSLSNDQTLELFSLYDDQIFELSPQYNDQTGGYALDHCESKLKIFQGCTPRSPPSIAALPKPPPDPTATDDARYMETQRF